MKKKAAVVEAPSKKRGRPRNPVVEEEVEEEEEEELEEEEEEEAPVAVKGRGKSARDLKWLKDNLPAGDDDEDEEESEEGDEDTPPPTVKTARTNGTGKKGKKQRYQLDMSDTMKPEDWQKILDQVSGGSGLFFFPKEGKTRMRLVAEPGSKNRWFIETQAVFRGVSRSKVICLAVLISGKGVTDEMKQKVMPVIVPKRVITLILQLLAEGYNLLNSTRGYGITIVRTGTGIETTYNVIASQSPIPLPPESELEWPEQETLSQLADVYEENQSSRDSQRATNRRGEEDEGDW